ncbi:hypothetical protein B0H65DRAFT_577753 [Neurospora tetraspora]|uniref:F-box domain-containing protein n=1 Tax=Neurospora tetraspora TaxID=94610 RepID=A0AAE0MP27_9PEZI|nr:hypothetical protein B0H65DRAFT_577753 [Neurospora tetraspora]
MVETRKAKTTRLALGLTEAQPKHSTFIRLPVEVRLMIYKHVWTPTAMPWEYDIIAQREGQPASDHMKQIHVLTSVCRHMRYEVIAEYFLRSQAHINYAAGDSSHCDGRSDMRVLASMWHLKRSSLFTEHLQHVRLNWLPINDWSGWTAWDNMVDKANARRDIVGPFAMAAPWGTAGQPRRVLRQMDTLKWLASLKSLRTLEITFIDVMTVHENDFVSFYDTLAWRKLMKMPKLEWITLRLFSGSARHEEWNWNSPERLSDREKVMDLKASLLKGPSAMLKKERKRCRIDTNVGAVTAEVFLSPAV